MGTVIKFCSLYKIICPIAVAVEIIELFAAREHLTRLAQQVKLVKSHDKIIRNNAYYYLQPTCESSYTWRAACLLAF
jgi:hypothetical protein